MKKIKKALLMDKLRLSKHAKERMDKRGYTKKDVISCVLSGTIIERQVYQMKLRSVIEGVDSDDLPMVIVIGYGSQQNEFVVVTAMPPITSKFRRVI